MARLTEVFIGKQSWAPRELNIAGVGKRTTANQAYKNSISSSNSGAHLER